MLNFKVTRTPSESVMLTFRNAEQALLFLETVSEAVRMETANPNSCGQFPIQVIINGNWQGGKGPTTLT